MMLEGDLNLKASRSPFPKEDLNFYFDRHHQHYHDHRDHLIINFKNNIFPLLNEIIEKSDSNIIQVDCFYHFLITLNEYYDQLFKINVDKWTLFRLNSLLLHTFGPRLSIFVVNFFSHYFLNYQEDPHSLLKIQHTIELLNHLYLRSDFKNLIIHCLCQFYDSKILINTNNVNPTDSTSNHPSLPLDVSFNSLRKKWIDENLLPFVKSIRCEEWIPQITAYTRLKLADIRLNELYHIISSYPKSDFALNDCIETMGQWNSKSRSTVSHLLKQSIENIYLISTSINIPTHIENLIQFFINAVIVLHRLDSDGVLSELILPQIQSYLKKSSQTMKKVAIALLNPNDQLIFEPKEVYSSPSGEKSAKQLSSPTSSSNDFYRWIDDEELNWSPDSIDYSPSSVSSYFKRRDIPEALLNCCKSKIFFFEEIQKYFGQLILYAAESDQEIFLRRLQSIKMQYGVAPLHGCDIMISDMKESRTYTQYLVSEITNLELIILSHLYWSNAVSKNHQNQNIVEMMPPEFLNQLKIIHGRFETLKPHRAIEWIFEEGEVECELINNYGNIKRTFLVKPIDYFIIEKFQRVYSWRVSDLSQSFPSKEKTATSFHERETLILESLRRWQDRKVVFLDADESTCSLIKDYI